MRSWLPLLLCFLLSSTPLHAELRIFTCEPEWAALAKELAGDKADIFTATTAQQDVHYIHARPSLIARLRRADLIVCTGADLEIGWLPVLLRRSGNPNVLPGAAGNFAASSYVKMLEKPKTLDRSEGDIHPEGNPHVHLDPRNLVPIAKALSERLASLDADNAASYRANAADFLQRWEQALQTWDQRKAKLKGMPTVVYHDAWIYLNHWLGLKQLAELEPKPGIPPTSRHLSSVLSLMKQQPARAIIYAPYQDAHAVQWLNKKTGIPGLQLPFTVGGNPQAKDLFTLFDSTLDLLLGASD